MIDPSLLLLAPPTHCNKEKKERKEGRKEERKQESVFARPSADDEIFKFPRLA
jgi:hypothetical protein